MEKDEAAKALADRWLETMSEISWEAAADTIRQRGPAPCGETTQLEEQGVALEVSDSWQWLGGEDGDIQLTVKVFEPDAPDEPLATRRHSIPRA